MCRHPSARHSLDAQRFGAAQRPWRKKRQRDSQTLCRQQSRYNQLRRREIPRQLQIQPASQQAVVHPPAQKRHDGCPYDRRGQHGRAGRHELLRVRCHPLRQHRPLGQSQVGETDCLPRKRAQILPPWQILRRSQTGKHHADRHQERRPDRPYQHGHTALPAARTARRPRQPPQSYRTERCQRQRPQTHRQKARRDRGQIPYPRHIPAHRQALRFRPFGKDRSQHERRLRLHRKPLLRPWRRQHPVQLQRRQTGKRPQHCRPDVPSHLRNRSPSSGEIPKRSGTDFQGHPHPSGSSQRNVEKGRPAQTAQIRPCRPRPQNPTLPQTRQTERRQQQQGREPRPRIRRQALRPPAARLPFRPSGKEAPAPEPAPRQFQHQRCHELVRQQTRHRRHPQARQQGRPGHRPYQQAQRLQTLTKKSRYNLLIIA